LSTSFTESTATSPAFVTTSADRDLQARVILFIKQRQVARGSNLTVLAHRGVITLFGVVPTFYQRQLLHSLVCRVAGVVLVQDELEVAPPDLPARQPLNPSPRAVSDLALTAC
jgi:osmotically-inducible protein OsmY